MKTILLIITVAALTNSCAMMKRDACNDQRMQEMGFNDAQDGKPMNTGAATSLCDDVDKARFSKIYTQSYIQSKEVNKPTNQISVNTPAPSPGLTLPGGFNVNFGGGSTQTVNSNTNSAKSCHARPGKDVHESFCINTPNTACNSHNICHLR